MRPPYLVEHDGICVDARTCVASAARASTFSLAAYEAEPCGRTRSPIAAFGILLLLCGCCYVPSASLHELVV